MPEFLFEFIEDQKTFETGDIRGSFHTVVKKMREKAAKQKKDWTFLDLSILVDGRFLPESRWVNEDDGTICEYL